MYLSLKPLVMKNLFYIAGLCTMVIFGSSFGCSNKNKIMEETPVTDSTQKSKVNSSGVIKQEGYSLPEDNASFTVESHVLKGDMLTLTVSFSGGCENHDFTGYFNGMFLKSMPPKANLLIHHNNNGDACRSVVTEKITFDLTNMRYGTKGPLIVQIPGYEKGPIEYKY